LKRIGILSLSADLEIVLSGTIIFTGGFGGVNMGSKKGKRNSRSFTSTRNMGIDAESAGIVRKTEA
jgi:hypothetical protein